ncbi:hypothetical protein Y032_0005g2280 [Ancylostoma ceylanicum]|uniref:Hexosyltransferase n=1 Tax=Ancylostoma ceylanicum TaxID=53326 RepID=A0A016VQX6_9BILA|nr:hypothetical protein Y032_0005g2280 [Ancylostoma ceylanicum]
MPICEYTLDIIDHPPTVSKLAAEKDWVIALEEIEKKSAEALDDQIRNIAQNKSEVPYVKEDTDVTIVVPISDESEVLPARRLLARHARLCTAPAEETRKTRVVVALLPGIDPRSATNIGNDLEELKRRCKRSGLESDLLHLQGVSGEKIRDRTSGDVGGGSVALDEAIDRYGSGSIFLLLSPYADVQKEFLDRARINTIKHYQVFFPIPFVEYHPTISGMDVEEHEVPEDQKEVREAALARLRDSSPPRRKRPLIVQKDHGRFDSLDFSCMAVYGSDYVAMRPKLTGKRLDLIAAFLSQNEVHVLRAIEPTLRLSLAVRLTPDFQTDRYARFAHMTSPRNHQRRIMGIQISLRFPYMPPHKKWTDQRELLASLRAI